MSQQSELERILAEMKAANSSDCEDGHSTGDDLLVATITALLSRYAEKDRKLVQDIVDAYHDICKWYA